MQKKLMQLVFIRKKLNFDMVKNSNTAKVIYRGQSNILSICIQRFYSTYLDKKHEFTSLAVTR